MMLTNADTPGSPTEPAYSATPLGHSACGAQAGTAASSGAVTSSAGAAGASDGATGADSCASVSVQTRLRPFALAAYSARSARASMVGMCATSGSDCVTPMLTVAFMP